MKASPPSSRAYVQGRRAETAAANGARIVAAARDLFLETGLEPTLDAVAERAEVTVQTVLRRYGTKEGLFAAALSAGLDEVAAQRGAVAAGDVAGAIDNLLDHYDAWGDRSLRLLWLEGRSPAAGSVVASGRALHRDWVLAIFGPLLDGLAAPTRRLRVASLVTVTDVHVWKLLRRDQGLSRAETRTALIDLVEGLVARGPGSRRTRPAAARGASR